MSRIQGNILPRFCLEGDISEMEHGLKELNSLTYRVTNRLSCSEGEVLQMLYIYFFFFFLLSQIPIFLFHCTVNSLYVDLIHNNICGDSTTWSIVVLCTSLAYTFCIFFFCWKCYTDRKRVKNIILADTRNTDKEKQAQMAENGSNGYNTAEERNGKTYGGGEAEDGKGKVDYTGETSFSPYG